MSQEAAVGRARKVYLVAWILVPVLILGAILYQLTGGSGRTTGPAVEPTRDEENHLARARDTLSRQADLATCRTIVQQLNAHLQTATDHQIPSLTAPDRLKAQLGLQDDDLAEVASRTFTPLDAHHLDACFLLRDAARSLEVAPMSGPSKSIKQSPLDRAIAGFAWVVRQVRLLPLEKQVLFDMPAPVAQVLRRGTGSPLERALVFLALLEQFGLDEDDTVGLQGCLVLVPAEKGQKRLWACGVAIGTQPESLYLFDPRMGQPVPGPKGEGVATLAQARADSSILGQLKIDKLAYDITLADAKAATLSVVVPLSAAAPRMHFLQDRLLRARAWQDRALPGQVRVRLAEDPSRALASIQKASGKPEEASIWQPGSVLLRRFLPNEEGGNDTGVPFEIRRLRGFTTDDDPRTARLPRERLYQLVAVPWEEYPPEFRDPERFRFDLGIGQRLRTIYMGPFTQPLTDPRSPREMILRGRFSRAVPELVEEQKQAVSMRQRIAEAGDLREGLINWVTAAEAAFADVLRAKGTGNESQANAHWEDMWKWKPNAPISVRLFGSMAGPRGADVMYQLALCRHEQAARYQARVDLATRAGLPLPLDARNAAKTWTDAEGYWKEFLDANAGRPAVAAARRLRGEAQAMLGEKEEAQRSLQDLSAPMTDLEKLACLWLAKQVAQPAKSN